MCYCGGMDTIDDILRAALAACDCAATENVLAGRGGPFAASLHVHDGATGTWHTIAGPLGNAVLDTGMASAHAEDRIIQPVHIAALRACLAEVGVAQAHVYVVSSGESCPACHAKLEILARELLHDGVLRPGSFTVVYGATYEDTARVAGFNDHLYHEDFQKPAGMGLVRQSRMEIAAVPDPVAVILRGASGPAAVVVSGPDHFAGTGAQPEITAIAAACTARKESGDPAPWDLRGAVLYTATTEIGPLAYAECQWANVAQWVGVTGLPPGRISAPEAPGIANDALFRIIATRPYTHQDSALSFRRITPFANIAQETWRARSAQGAVAHYNGAGQEGRG